MEKSLTYITQENDAYYYKIHNSSFLLKNELLHLQTKKKVKETIQNTGYVFTHLWPIQVFPV